MNNLIKIEGKPIEKLIDVVSNTIGTIYEPKRIIRKAKADAKSNTIIAIEQAKTKAIIDGDLKQAQYLEQISERIINKEKKRQKNLEDVITVAGNILQTEKEVSGDQINLDWATRFFDIVQDISDNEMKNLWGQILAGEIKQPKSYSLRTLEVLRNMTKDEAELFQKIAPLVLVQRDSFIYSSEEVLKKFGVTYSDIAKLIEIGLLQSGDFVHKSFFSSKSENSKVGIIYGNLVIIIELMANASKISIPVRLLTIPGTEIVKLINFNPNIDYIKEIANIIKKNDIKVSYSKIISIETNGDINYDDIVIDL